MHLADFVIDDRCFPKGPLALTSYNKCEVVAVLSRDPEQIHLGGASSLQVGRLVNRNRNTSTMDTVICCQCFFGASLAPDGLHYAAPEAHNHSQ